MILKNQFLLATFVMLVAPGLGSGQCAMKASAPAPAREITQLMRLRDEYSKATKDYRSSLQKLLPLYESNRTKAEERFAQSRDFFKHGFIEQRDLDASEREVAEANKKVEEVQRQITDAETKLLQIPTDEEVAAERKQLARDYRRALATNPTCRSWSLVASRHQSAHAVTVSITVVCHR